MIPSTFLLITLLCVLPPPPVACKKNMLKHLHKEIHQISDVLSPLSDSCNIFKLIKCTGELATIIPDCVTSGSLQDKLECIIEKTKTEFDSCLPCVCKIVC